jgi:hypothetical protein
VKDMFYYNKWEFKEDDSFKKARNRLHKGFKYGKKKEKIINKR